MYPLPLDLSKLKVFPLAERRSLTQVESILVDPDTHPAPLSDATLARVAACATEIRAAREREATVMLIYGAHLLRNGAALILDRLMADGWLNHLATNGAGTIHDWEYAWLGRSTESVEQNVRTGSFGTWDETGRNIHLALLAGGLRHQGYGGALGQFISEDGADFPSSEKLWTEIQSNPEDRLNPARMEWIEMQRTFGLPQCRLIVEHLWKHASILASAWNHQVPLTVHPGIGYDIIANHPFFNGAVIGRAATRDFELFGGSVENLDGGVVLSVGSAIMGPQVFEKSLSCVNNIRLQSGRPIVQGHSICVVDLQDGGGWDWSQGEPPKTNPAYYLRFCKSYSRMGGTMQYVQADNLAFMHHLYHLLKKS